MEFSELRAKLINSLMQMENAKMTSDEREIHTRCPFCAGGKSRHSAHCYFKIPMDKGDMPVFYCQLCKSTGVLSHKNLGMILNSHTNIGYSISKYVNQYKHLSRNKQYFSGLKKFNMKIPVPTNSKRNMRKLHYINKRMGTSMTLEDTVKFKIVLSLYELLDYNNIESMKHVHPKRLEMLNLDYIGFLSRDNSYLNMRKVNPHNTFGKRYENLNIHNKFSNIRKFYVMPIEVNVLSKEPINIHITEGCFDALGVFNKNKESNAIHVAANGTGMKWVIQYFHKLGFIDSIIHIWSDKDIVMSKHEKYFIQLGRHRFIHNPLVHYNNLGNDFGIPKDEIEVSTIPIKFRYKG